MGLDHCHRVSTPLKVRDDSGKLPPPQKKIFSLLICQISAQILDPHNILQNYVVELNMVITTLRRTLHTES